eukprot:1142811-Pelagomonas_calceolata.AAC.5
MVPHESPTLTIVRYVAIQSMLIEKEVKRKEKKRPAKRSLVLKKGPLTSELARVSPKGPRT